MIMARPGIFTNFFLNSITKVELTFGNGSNKGPIQRITTKTNDAENIL